MIERACWNCENCRNIVDGLDVEMLVCEYSGMEIHQNGCCDHWESFRPHCLICSHLTHGYDENLNYVHKCSLKNEIVENYCDESCDKYEWIGDEDE